MLIKYAFTESLGEKDHVADSFLLREGLVLQFLLHLT